MANFHSLASQLLLILVLFCSHGARIMADHSVIVECFEEVDEAGRNWPSYSPPAERSWQTTVPKHGDFEKHNPVFGSFFEQHLLSPSTVFVPTEYYKTHYTIEGRTSEPLDYGSVICSSEEVSYSSSSYYDSISQTAQAFCQQVIEKVGFLPNSKQFLSSFKNSSVYTDDTFYDFDSNKNVTLNEPDELVLLDTVVDADRPFLRFWIATNDTNATIRVVNSDFNFNDDQAESLIEIDPSLCPGSTSQWQRYTVSLVNDKSNLIPEYTFDDYYLDYYASNLEISLNKPRFLKLFITSSKNEMIAIDNIELVGVEAVAANGSNLINNTLGNRDTDIQNIELEKADVRNYFQSILETPVDLIFILLPVGLLLLMMSYLVFLRCNLVRGKKVLTVFLFIWPILSLSLIVYAFVELNNFEALVREIDEQAKEAFDDFEASLASVSLNEIIDRNNGVEPYGPFSVNILSISPNINDWKLLFETILDFPEEQGWTAYQKQSVNEIELLAPQILCLPSDNCNYVYNENSCVDASKYDQSCLVPSGCSCSSFVTTNLKEGDACQSISANFSKIIFGTNGENESTTYNFNDYVNMLNTTCPPVEKYDLSYLSNIQAVESRIANTNASDILSLYVVGSARLTQQYFVDALRDSLILDVVASIIVGLLLAFTWLSLRIRKRFSSVVEFRLRAGIEIINVMAEIASIVLLSRVIYLAIQNPVRVETDLVLNSVLQQPSTHSITNQSGYTVTDIDDTSLFYTSTPVFIKQNEIVFREGTFQPVIPMPVNTVSGCFESFSSLMEWAFGPDTNILLLDLGYKTPLLDIRTSEGMCDFNNIEVDYTNNCYSYECNGYIPLISEAAVEDRINFLYANLLYSVGFIDVAITTVELFVIILSIMLLRLNSSEERGLDSSADEAAQKSIDVKVLEPSV